ncbi:hypothetical protein NKH18_26905 [Streptomyces sp. M10(2022)]
MTKTRRIATTLAGTAAVLAAISMPGYAADAPTSAGAAASCYGSAYSYQGSPAGSGTYAFYPSWGTWDSVDGNCSDINIKTNYTREVRVCTHNKCHGWVKAPKGSGRSSSTTPPRSRVLPAVQGCERELGTSRELTQWCPGCAGASRAGRLVGQGRSRVVGDAAPAVTRPRCWELRAG